MLEIHALLMHILLPSNEYTHKPLSILISIIQFIINLYIILHIHYYDNMQMYDYDNPRPRAYRPADCTKA